MKINKNDLKIFFLFVFGMTLSSVISVSATAGIIRARDVVYNDNGKEVDVEQAIATLYDGVEIAMVTPVGAILPYMGTTAPDQYLICDGKVYNISDYPKLAKHIKTNFGSYNKFGGNGTTTFAVPDLRGEFLRGAGTNGHANQGSGAAVGGHQDASRINQPGQSLTYTTNGSGIYAGHVNSSTGALLDNSDHNLSVAHYWVDYGANRLSGNGTSSAVRPTNTAVNYIIKVR